MNRISTIGVALALGALVSPAFSMGTNPSTPPGTKADSGYTAAERAVKAKQYQDAITKLGAVLAKDPKNVDALNYMAYSHRQLGHYDVALGYYRRALAINPDHRGANEYLGELYIKLGKMQQARTQLAKLRHICGTRCEEFQALQAAIAKAGGRS
jgi:tetratricopeptide (TPR) repeat protein